MLNARNLFIFALIFGAAALRVWGDLPYNFTPVAAIALFGGAMFANRALALIVPVGIMLLSDALIGFHPHIPAVYASFLLIVGIGHLIRKNPTMLKAIGGGMVGSLLFFLITNAAVWYGASFYSQDLGGLLDSYAAGIPFFRGTFVGDLLFTTVLFGSYKLAELKLPTLVKA